MLELIEAKAQANHNRQSLNRIPLSTYRIQLQAGVNLDEVYQLLPYLEQLGVSDLYLSPLFRARDESSHGYDVVDHGTIDPSIGDLAALERLAQAARTAGMGILLDVVPNHMGINDPVNVWWLDVLENGEGAYFAGFFDIDWRPAASALQDTVLLPFLGEPFGSVLENGDLKIVYVDQRLQLCYGPHRYPLAPPTWTGLLDLADELGMQGAAQEIAAPPDDWLELQSIITQLRHLPPGSSRDDASMEQRYREQRIARQRLNQLIEASSPVREALDMAIRQFNGEPGNPKSFDQLEKLLDQQWYRLAYWRVASDEINYRRFFDINELAAIRVEDSRVFDAVHRLVGQLLQHGWVTGLRIDHPDGLRDPLVYFKNLQGLYRSQRQAGDAAESIYVVAEKILSEDEQLATDWPVCGTTGYDLMNLLTRVLIDPEGLSELRTFYVELGHDATRPADVVYESKRAILLQSMSSELQMLTAQLYRIAQQHRASRDFTRPSLQRALREVVACMTVYRTYVRSDSWDVSEADYRVVTTAVRMAKRRNRTLPFSVFDFIASVLLLEHPPTVSEELAAERRQFTVKLQQVTGPVAAKGVEDTAFYRYYPLASLNEVGGDLAAKPIANDEFHRWMRQRLADWPHSLSATATHDSKRGEDFRARLNVLSEIPRLWIDAFQRWREMNRGSQREIDGEMAPNGNEQYLLYQTLVGTWPTEQMTAAELDSYCGRIVQYMHKALREAKIHTSWINPSEAYEAATLDFVRDLLGQHGAAFQADLTRFVREIADSGLVNSLTQLLLKLTVPGVPDFYQGSELWDFNLVDPDNRRPVDFTQRRDRLNRLLDEGQAGVERAARALAARWPDPDVKLWTITRALALRRSWPDVFSCGDYVPLAASGPAAEQVLSFARRFERQCVVVVVPRLYHRLRTRHGPAGNGVPPADWKGTQLMLPDEWSTPWHDRLTGRRAEPKSYPTCPEGNQLLDVGQLLSILPVALLSSELGAG
jgi:(1->4)-alpha-D-glucan 1-alpha-D-glucosylmutase